jgi:hypothetical protein
LFAGIDINTGLFICGHKLELPDKRRLLV